MLGATLVTFGVTAFYVDDKTRSTWDLIQQHYDALGTSILAGILLAFAGSIGWAKRSDKRRRRSMAGIVFIFPFAVLVLGSAADGANFHGPFAIAAMLIAPATILAVVLLIMAI